MRRLITAAVAFLMISFVGVGLGGLVPAPALAQGDPLEVVCRRTPQASACKASDENPITGPEGLLTRAIEILGWVVGVAAVIMIIIGGLRYVLSEGDTAGVNNAKNTILYALIGVAIAVMAQALVLFVLRRL